jgi:hypothetical protein
VRWSIAFAATVASLAAGRPAGAQSQIYGSIVVFDAGADGDAEPMRVIGGPATGLHFPDEIVVDRQQRLYVTARLRSDPVDTIRIFAPDADGNVAPERMIAGPHTGLDTPMGLGMDRDGRLYVGNGGLGPRKTGSSITVYSPGAAGDATPIRTLAGGGAEDNGQWPNRLVFGRRDSLYVKTVALVAVYAPGATGATVPVRLIYKDVPRPPGGAYGRRLSPERFVLDPYDSMYVVQRDTVMVYPPGYDGSQLEVRWVAGPHTGIHETTDIALDDRGFLYVTDADSSLIKVFAPGATGDAAPVRRIGGPTTRLFVPARIVTDRKRRLYVANVLFRNPIRFGR